ncbi:hypothetical protein AC1031_004018 [Aphanomyces cochlioides]|nr:hypothetical protein AC1031_004018 [Aphanomyces cochlioides]
MSVPRGVSKANEDLWSKFIRLDTKHGAYYQVQCKACAEYAHIHGTESPILQGRIERMKTHMAKCPHSDFGLSTNDMDAQKRSLHMVDGGSLDNRRDIDDKRLRLDNGHYPPSKRLIDSERLRKLEENREQLEQQLLMEKIKREKINAIKDEQQCKVELLLARQNLREKGVPQDEIDLLLPITQPANASTFI